MIIILQSKYSKYHRSRETRTAFTHGAQHILSYNKRTFAKDDNNTTINKIIMMIIILCVKRLLHWSTSAKSHTKRIQIHRDTVGTEIGSNNYHVFEWSGGTLPKGALKLQLKCKNKKYLRDLILFKTWQ